MTRINVVAGNIRKKQVKSKAFRLTVLMPIIVIIISGLIGYFMSRKDDTKKIGLVAGDDVATYFKNTDAITFKRGKLKDFQKKSKEDEDTSYVIAKIKDQVLELDYVGDVTDNEEISQVRLIADNIQKDINIKEAKISKSQKNILETKPMVKLKSSEKGENKAKATAFSMFAIIFMFIILSTYTNTIVTDIAQEKGTKMIEFIFSSIRPGQYFLGKILGNLLVVATHIGFYVVVGLITFGLNYKFNFFDVSDIGIKLSLNAGTVSVQLTLLLLFGLFIYLLMAAGLGSLTTKLEDAGKMVGPLMIIIFIAYYISIIHTSGALNGTSYEVISMIPFFSTFLMPARLLSGEATAGEGRLSILILLVSIFIVYIISAKMYKKNILNYSTDRLFRRNGPKIKKEN